MERRALSPPDVGSLTPNWVNNFYCVLYCFHSFSFVIITIAWSIVVVGCFFFLPHTLVQGLLVCFWFEFTTIGAHRGARVNRIKAPWVKLSGNNFELWKVKREAILMVEKMDKTWSVVIRCLEGKKLKEIAMKFDLERRW